VKVTVSASWDFLFIEKKTDLMEHNFIKITH
jgi:hypothetical protein